MWVSLCSCADANGLCEGNVWRVGEGLSPWPSPAQVMDRLQAADRGVDDLCSMGSQINESLQPLMLPFAHLAGRDLSGPG